jgi:hypothetical protein
MANIKDRHSIPTQIAVAEQNLRLALNERSELAYKHAVEPTAESAAQLDALEAEIAGHRLDIERLQLAAEVASRVKSERDIQAEREAQVARVQRLGELHEEITEASKELVKHLTSVHKPLAQLQAALRERGGVAWAACSAPFPSGSATHRHIGPAFARLTGGTPESALVLAALAQSGLGRMGPSLEPFCTFELAGTGAPGDALQRLADAQEGLIALIEEAAVIAATPPRTDDQYPEEIEPEETNHE